MYEAEQASDGEVEGQLTSGDSEVLLPFPDDAGTEPSDDEASSIPEDAIEENFRQIRKELAAELLEQIMDNSPTFFEELVIDLLVEMGYGGSREDAEAVGRSGDGGIDGIINEDRLGLDVVVCSSQAVGRKRGPA